MLILAVTSACSGDPIQVSETAEGVEIDSVQQDDVIKDNPTENLFNLSLEKMAAVLVGSNVQLRVLSNGCTSAEHFSIAQEAPDECRFAVTRNRPDFCKRATRAVSLTIQWQPPVACTADEIRFSNPPLAE